MDLKAWGLIPRGIKKIFEMGDSLSMQTLAFGSEVFTCKNFLESVSLKVLTSSRKPVPLYLSLFVSVLVIHVPAAPFRIPVPVCVPVYFPVPFLVPALVRVRDPVPVRSLHLSLSLSMSMPVSMFMIMIINMVMFMDMDMEMGTDIGRDMDTNSPDTGMDTDRDRDMDTDTDKDRKIDSKMILYAQKTQANFEQVGIRPL